MIIARASNIAVGPLITLLDTDKKVDVNSSETSSTDKVADARETFLEVNEYISATSSSACEIMQIYLPSLDTSVKRGSDVAREVCAILQNDELISHMSES